MPPSNAMKRANGWWNWPPPGGTPSSMSSIKALPVASRLGLLLAYAFLLTLLKARAALLRLWLLRYYAHRTGAHCRTARLPLTRLRCALSRLWQDWPPNFASLGSARTLIYVSEVN